MKFLLAISALVAGVCAQSSSLAHASSVAPTQSSASATTLDVVSQISDGQAQAPTATTETATTETAATETAATETSATKTATETATTATGVVVSQISDGQPQAPTSTQVVTGNAGSVDAAFALLIGGAAAAMLF